jgi:Domain of unknown function (DUF4157)
MTRLIVRMLSRSDSRVDTQLPGGVLVRRARWLPVLGGALARMRGPAAAVTIGATIVVHPDVRLSQTLLRHELEHVRQWQAHPRTFYLRYILAHLRYGYRENPFEVAARRAERDAAPESAGRQEG